MNDADSKAQQAKMYHNNLNAGKLIPGKVIALPVINQLKTKVTEQDREIERQSEKIAYQYRRAEKWRARAEKAEADNLRLQERVRELEELLDWIERYTGARFNQNHRLIAIRDQARQALQHKEKG